MQRASAFCLASCLALFSFSIPAAAVEIVSPKNGDVLPTVLVDGFVAATWNIDRKRGLELEPLRRLTKAERAEILEEGERLVDFVRA